MDNKDELLSKLADTLQVDPKELTDDFALTTENWDSFAQLGAISVIDETFGITVPANELKNCLTIGDLVNLVRQNLTTA